MGETLMPKEIREAPLWQSLKKCMIVIIDICRKFCFTHAEHKYDWQSSVSCLSMTHQTNNSLLNRATKKKGSYVKPQKP